MHDTHTHLEMLLNKLNLIADQRYFDDNNQGFELSMYVKNQLGDMLINHSWVLQSTVSTDNYVFVSKLLADFEKVKFFVGSHPEIVNADFDLSQYLLLQQKLDLSDFDDKRIVGIGEIGLDYHYTQDPLLINKQKQLFESQIQLAIDLDLPIMIHCREAFEDVFEILDKFPQIFGKFLVHCWTGNRSQLTQVLDRGGKVAFGGVCTFKSAVELQEVVKICPNNSFVLETDLPFLSPIPHRGQVCLPIMIDDIATQVATLKSLSKAQIWEYSLHNSQQLFNLTTNLTTL